jgi:hypothetical protein
MLGEAVEQDDPAVREDLANSVAQLEEALRREAEKIVGVHRTACTALVVSQETTITPLSRWWRLIARAA